VRAVNDVGAAPGDLMAILEALKEAGALKAELVVILHCYITLLMNIVSTLRKNKIIICWWFS
jgi:hypothetical protein